ncbi:MAG: DUF504 domain-containing protein [Candidatus Woesearchaeota archaeon]
MTIREELNRIKWHEKDKEKYIIFYSDRASRTIQGIRFTEIKEIENNFFIVNNEGKEIEIPLHRIKEIRKEDKLIWRRNN